VLINFVLPKVRQGIFTRKTQT